MTELPESLTAQVGWWRNGPERAQACGLSEWRCSYPSEDGGLSEHRHCLREAPWSNAPTHEAGEKNSRELYEGRCDGHMRETFREKGGRWVGPPGTKWIASLSLAPPEAAE